MKLNLGKFSVIPANGVIGANRKTVIDFTACKSIEELLTPAFAVEVYQVLSSN